MCARLQQVVSLEYTCTFYTVYSHKLSLGVRILISATLVCHTIMHHICCRYVAEWHTLIRFHVRDGSHWPTVFPPFFPAGRRKEDFLQIVDCPRERPCENALGAVSRATASFLSSSHARTHHKRVHITFFDAEQHEKRESV